MGSYTVGAGSPWPIYSHPTISSYVGKLFERLLDSRIRALAEHEGNLDGSGTFRHQPFGQQYGVGHMGDESVDQMGWSKWSNNWYI